jgi:hypothetical protein
MSSLVSTIFNQLLSGLFDIHFYMGIVLGAMFTPFWIMLWNFFKKKLEAKVPMATPVIAEVEAAAKVVEAELAPVVAVVEAQPEVVAAQPKV